MQFKYSPYLCNVKIKNTINTRIMFDYEALQIAHDMHRAYFKTISLDEHTDIIISKYTHTKFEVRVVEDKNHIIMIYGGLGPWDCLNLIEELKANVKNVNSLA